MSMVIRQGLMRNGSQGYRERLTQKFPKLAAMMQPFWDSWDKKYGAQPPAGQEAAPSASAALGAAPSLPQAGGRTSKTLLGM